MLAASIFIFMPHLEFDAAKIGIIFETNKFFTIFFQENIKKVCFYIILYREMCIFDSNHRVGE